MRVGLFTPYDNEVTPEPVAPIQTATPIRGPAKKSTPTPTRRQAEQARRNRIQPNLTRKEARELERKNKYKARDEAEAKINAYPPNILIRDWVDSRWTLTEFLMPVILVVLAISIGGAYFWAPMMNIATYLTWGLFIAVILDVLIMWLGLRGQLRTHFPQEPLKGKFVQLLSRAMKMRRTRIPAPRVKRGSQFIWPHPDDR